MTVVLLAGLDDFVEVADRAFPHGTGQGSVLPHRFLTLDQEPPEQIGGRQIVVARDGMERTAEPSRHVAHEPGLAASGGALQQSRQPAAAGCQKHLLFVALGQIEGQLANIVRTGAHGIVLVRTVRAREVE